MSVLSTHASSTHSFTKPSLPYINLIANLGVEGDCHNGHTVQHRSRLHIKPPPVNLRQVHLMDVEVLTPSNVKPGDLGENITVQGLGMLALSKGTRLHFLQILAEEETQVEKTVEEREHAIVQVEGLRNPCPQIDSFRKGLKEDFIIRDAQRQIMERRAGIMGTVIVGGKVERGMKIKVEAPEVFTKLDCV